MTKRILPIITSDFFEKQINLLIENLSVDIFFTNANLDLNLYLLTFFIQFNFIQNGP